jgi:tetratricopeptide (TPR) repeat protein
LENTRAGDGTVAAPLLYLGCLIRQGQLEKAAREIRPCLRANAAVPGGHERLAELAAALALATPGAAPPADDACAALWRNAVETLRAWCLGEPAEAVERRLAGLPLRSAFRPLRLILKALLIGPAEPDKAAGLLAMVPANGPFGAFATAVKVASARDADAMLAGWNRLRPRQRDFVAQARGLAATATAVLGQIEEAERRGPAALLALLLRPPAGLPRDDLRAACVELLVQVPEQLAQVERVFGALADIEKHRVLALAAELKQNPARAEPHWRGLAEALGRQCDPQARLAQAVVYRRLADLAAEHGRGGDTGEEDAQARYLERSLAADPAHLPTALQLIALHREAGRNREWYRAVDQALQTFPADSAVLAQAVDAAMARKSYKKAAGFARRLLTLDPINQAVRQQMIGLQIARARTQMQAARPDLAWQALAEAAGWQRADLPEASVRLTQGLVGSRLGRGAAAEALLQEGVRLAGGGVVGWFRAALEATLMGVADGVGEVCGRELDRARQTAPGREAILAVIGILDRREIGVGDRVLTPLVVRIETWLRAGAPLAWSGAEFVAIAGQLQRFRLFGALAAYAGEAGVRAPQEAMPRFFAIVAATEGDGRRCTAAQEDALQALETQVLERQDVHTARRIRQFLEGPPGASRAGRPGQRFDAGEAEALFDLALDGLPNLFPRKEIRRMVTELGREGAVDAISDTLHDSPFDMVLTPPQIRRLAEAAVLRVLAAGARR